MNTYAYMYARVMVKEQPVPVSSSSISCGEGRLTQVSLGSQRLYPLSHLTDTPLAFLLGEIGTDYWRCHCRYLKSPTDALIGVAFCAWCLNTS